MQYKLEGKYTVNIAIEKWGMFEAEFMCAETANPFVDVSFSAEFCHDETKIKVSGFYDGDDTFRIRFMPKNLGEWTYKTISNKEELDGKEGSFTCVEAKGNNHGPVKVSKRLHFAYADGTPYYPFGTTSYGWAHQKDKLAYKTIDSLKNSPFNKIRTGVTPHYSKSSDDNMRHYPYVGEAPSDWDFSRFNPKYFQMIEDRIQRLMDIGVEADLIMLHPYAKDWGYTQKPQDADVAFLKYCVSRFAAYRNIWWSLANEYDMFETKTLEEWDDLCKVVQKVDPYNHLLSIHNYMRLYENWKPWITHATVQDGMAVDEAGRAVLMVKAYHKPVIYDEVCYEGNFDIRWGNLSAEEMTRRFWNGMIAGAYVGHGEVIDLPDENGELVWTAVGGNLKGDSISRIDFLRKIIEDGSGHGWEAVDKWWLAGMAKKDEKHFLVYFGNEKPGKWKFFIPSKDVVMKTGTKYKVEIIDTWNMTIDQVDATFIIGEKDQYGYPDSENRAIDLPDKKYIAIRLTPEK